MKILIMGLPGSGKTTLAKYLTEQIDCVWLNADIIRAQYNDWDFSEEGRLRQARRMRSLADATHGHVIADFVAPTEQIRSIFDADLVIWMDTIRVSRFEDTNQVFENPSNVDVIINSFNYDINSIIRLINN